MAFPFGENLLRLNSLLGDFIKAQISSQEFLQKRYEIAKDILASAVTASEIQNGDSKLRSSMIFNCIQMADSLLEELYLSPFGPNETNEEVLAKNSEKSIHKIADILKNSEDK